MARPTDRGEVKSEALNIRMTPNLKARLEAHAGKSGRKLSSEVEERLLRSVEQSEGRTPETEALLAELGRLIGEIEAATKQRWHTGVKAWAAVQQMLRAGPIIVRAPPEIAKCDGKLKGLIDERISVSKERVAIAKSLKIAGINTGLAMYFAPPQGGRDELRRHIEELGLPPTIRENALVEVEALEALDARELDISERAEKITAPFKQAIEHGREIYEKPGMGWTLATVLRRLEFAEQGELLGILAPQRSSEQLVSLPETTLADAGVSR